MVSERLRNAILSMWEGRFALSEVESTSVGVDLDHLTAAHEEVLALTGTDELLPEEDDTVVNLDEVRIRTEKEFEGEVVAYVEALWGKETHGYNALVRDLEGMRRGTEDPDKPLRPPETYHEASHLILHVRALANDLARHFGLDEFVRPEDDFGTKR